MEAGMKGMGGMDGLAPALRGRPPEQGSELWTFGRFVGSWDLEWSATDADGRALRADGELHFGWVLGGQAVQDVWIVPGPGEPGHATRPHAFFGTTIRFYDAELGAWRSTWVEPVNGRVRTFVGRLVGDDIELVSLDGSPLLRWRFTDIGPAAFTWLGESSTDEGRTWRHEERMRATKRPRDAAPVPGV
jgi:hypothetical protein